MLIKAENKKLISRDYMLYNSQQSKSERTNHYEEEEEGELEIDLDYNEYVEVGIKEEDEPLDLSMKTLSKRCNDQPVDLQRPKLPRLDIKPNFQIFSFEATKPSKPETESPVESKGTFITDFEVTQLLDPYVKNVQKKFLCTVCDMKFANKSKALTHVENKHVDCLQYKCPLCRASKVTRLAYESHLRRGHSARVDQDQAIFRVNRREEFSGGWFAFKGLKTGSWSDLYDSVFSEFINRNIFKQITSDDLVFQVYCIKQLLK